MSGGKGGSQTTEVKVPQYIEDAAKANLARADEISRIGYTPYYGPDVAAFSPMQQASFQNTADTASAFGLAAPTTQQDIMGEIEELRGKVVTQAEFDDLADRAIGPVSHELGGVKSKLQDLSRRVGAMQMDTMQAGFDQLGSPR